MDAGPRPLGVGKRRDLSDLAVGRPPARLDRDGGAVLLGYGAGAGVAPGLFLAGFSVPSSKIGPTFALVELLRSEAAFLLGPVLVALAISVGLPGGIRLAIAITLGFVVVSGLTLVGVPVGRRAPP